MHVYYKMATSTQGTDQFGHQTDKRRGTYEFLPVNLRFPVSCRVLLFPFIFAFIGLSFSHLSSSLYASMAASRS